jgi:hypothetical protein
MRQEVRVIRWVVGTAALVVAACGDAGEAAPPGDPAPPERPAARGDAAAVVAERELRRIEAEAARVDSVLQPLPLLRPAQENALQRFRNADHLARARALGVGRLLPPPRVEQLHREGALVLLEDSDHWVIRDMDHSRPLAVPAVRALLEEVGDRFHARLAELGAPAFRLEVTSVLRTAEDQAALRRVNPNAAVGESTHEYGTTVDVLYSAFSAPARPLVEIDDGGVEWLAPLLSRHVAVAAERVAGRRALELKRILGEVLIEMQDEGKVMVTLERLQPVYHMTVARGL